MFKVIKRCLAVLLFASAGVFAQSDAGAENELQLFHAIDEAKRTILVSGKEYRLSLSARYWSPEKDRIPFEELVYMTSSSVELKLDEKGDVKDMFFKEAF
jgi:hypothetical protein